MRKQGLILGAGNIPSDFQPQGRLWRYDPDGTLHQMADEIICGNAVEWSPDNKTCEIILCNSYWKAVSTKEVRSSQMS